MVASYRERDLFKAGAAELVQRTGERFMPVLEPLAHADAVVNSLTKVTPELLTGVS